MSMDKMTTPTNWKENQRETYPLWGESDTEPERRPLSDAEAAFEKLIAALHSSGLGQSEINSVIELWKRATVSAQPGDAVALLREARDILKWADLSSSGGELVRRIDAHLSSAKSAGVQEPLTHVIVDGPDGKDYVAKLRVPLYAAASAKAGYVSVPMEPTEKMCKAAHRARQMNTFSPYEFTYADIYKAMLAAAAASEQRGGSDE